MLVSYSWEGGHHEQWVLQLATRIRRVGFDVRLDRWHRENRESLTGFMEREAREADCILTILTPRYAERAGGASDASVWRCATIGPPVVR